MPLPVVKSMAKKAGIAEKKAEEYWKKAEAIAKKAHEKGKVKSKDGIYPYTMGIFKNMMGLKENTEWMEEDFYHGFVRELLNRGEFYSYVYVDPTKEIPDEIKAIVESIETKVSYSLNDLKEPIETHYVKLKLHSKLQALAKIDQLMGYNEPEKFDVKQNTNVVIGTGSVENIRKAFGLIATESQDEENK